MKAKQKTLHLVVESLINDDIEIATEQFHTYLNSSIREEVGIKEMDDDDYDMKKDDDDYEDMEKSKHCTCDDDEDMKKDDDEDIEKDDDEDMKKDSE